MADTASIVREGRLALKFSAVSLIGLAVDAGLLHAGIWLGASPALARLVSLLVAMQATFVLTGLYVFHWDRARLAQQWLGYMGANGVGAVCNYAIFLALIWTGWPVLSDRLVALGIGAFTAWIINFLGARFVFRKARSAG